MQKNFIVVVLSLSVMLSACGRQATAIPAIPPLSAALSELQGTVMAKQSGQSDFTHISGGYVLGQNGEIQTGDDGRVRLDLSTGTIIRIAPTSLFTLISNTPTGNSLSSSFKLDLGRIWIILTGGTADVQTPSGVASVRGSYLMVEVVSGGGVKLTCLEGTCNIKNASGDFPLITGQSAFILNAQTPPFVQTMTEAEIQQWLAANPEATLVIPSLTAPAPSATTQSTAASAPTAIEVPPTAVPYVPPQPLQDSIIVPTPTSVPYVPSQPPEGPTIVPTPTPDHNALYLDVSNISINGGRFNVNVSAGGPVTVNFIYKLWNQADCRDCIDQLLVGLDNGGTKTGYGCGYDAIPGAFPGTGPGYHNSNPPVTFNAPAASGTYPIGISLLQYYNCTNSTEPLGALPFYGGGIYQVIGSITVSAAP